ncbi:MAG: NUDIX hydrolase [Deltaproteobacteria bacterium]|nr:NUDIX hydrolase [Deltaproteobacteria bacterium]
MKEVVGFHIDSDELVGEGGFLKLRRMRMRNRHPDGSLSEQYCCDTVARPYGQDAVVVAVFSRSAAGIQVLLRDGLRPGITRARDVAAAPITEEPPGLFVTELVAGIIEAGDRGEAGLRMRAVHETLEEAGFAVEPDKVFMLGAGMLPSPGAMVEKLYFMAVEVDPATQQPLAGDGSPMEEGATTRWRGLEDTIAACVRGEITDLKTEAALRRLRDALS